jgi:hypothetical protein
MGTMVGVDAFSQALTNPLLAKDIYNERTFSAAGLHEIREINSLGDLVHRNVSTEGETEPLVSFDRRRGVGRGLPGERRRRLVRRYEAPGDAGAQRDGGGNGHPWYLSGLTRRRQRSGR